MEFRFRRQLSVLLENQPGVLARVCDHIARTGINIEALSLLDTVEAGVLRLVTDDIEATADVLRTAGLQGVLGEVVEIRLQSGPGILGQLSRALAAREVNIEYIYGTDISAGNFNRIILKASPATSLRDVLRELGTELTTS